VWIEMMRVDEATQILGQRINVWTSVLVFLGALIYFVRVRGPREYVVPIDAPDAPADEPAGSDLSQVDVSDRVTAKATAPPGYQVVSEERFLAYQRTGVLDPDAAEPAAAPITAAPITAAPITDTPITDTPITDAESAVVSDEKK
jgi:hypothetical protein